MSAIRAVDYLIAMVRRRLREDGQAPTEQRRVKVYLHSGEEYEFRLAGGEDGSVQRLRLRQGAYARGN